LKSNNNEFELITKTTSNLILYHFVIPVKPFKGRDNINFQLEVISIYFN